MIKLDREDKGFLTEKDFEPYFHPSNVKIAFESFKYDDQRRINEKELNDTIKAIYKGRQDLARSLENRDDVGGVLNFTLKILIFIITAAAAPIVFGVDWSSSGIPLFTFILALSFIFGGTLKNAFESVIFLVFVNAYAVGDRVGIGDMTVVIHKIRLLTTDAYTMDGRFVSLVNSSLDENMIINFTRSRDYAQTLRMVVDFSTTAKQIMDLKAAIQGYLTKNSKVSKCKLIFPLSFVCQKFKTLLMFNVVDIEAQNKLLITIRCELNNITWIIPSAYKTPFTELILFVQEQAQGLGLIFTLPDQKITLNKLKKC